MSTVFQRVLLIFERMNHTAEMAVRTATDLAGLHGTPLLGLYVEDLNVLRSAALPGSTEIRSSTAASNPLTGTLLERQLQDEATRLKQLLTAAHQHAPRRFDFSFEIRRGLLTEEVQHTILPGDLVIIHKTPRQPVYVPARSLLDATLRVNEPFTLLLLGNEAAEGQVGVLIDTAGVDTDAVLTAAANLAQNDRTPLAVFLAVDEKDRAQAQATLNAAATRLNRTIDCRVISAGQPAELIRKLGRFQGRALVASRTGPFMSSPAGRQFLQSAHVPLYLVAT